jgi:hypothetical protein
MESHNTTSTIEAIVDEEKPSRVGHEVTVRLSNRNRHPRPSSQVANTSAGKQHCVGDYSCCGHVP